MNSQPVSVARTRDSVENKSGDAEQKISNLIRDLLRCVDDGSGRPNQELILDTEVDGVRYLLIRPAYTPPRIQNILSPRELEIARMVAKGYPNKIIAGVLDISSWTVCTHLRRIFAKLGVTSRAAMVARVVEAGVTVAQQ